uniref:Uncharacterized protein n=1 Tax=Oryza sativa subsp. japonica TaxID=39947 RepID=Q60F28_ORYSJ|nr:hypothetical protein [Oryza sativa Japonica Group]
MTRSETNSRYLSFTDSPLLKITREALAISSRRLAHDSSPSESSSVSLCLPRFLFDINQRKQTADEGNAKMMRRD